MKTTLLSLALVVASLAGCRETRPAPVTLSPPPAVAANDGALDRARAAEVHNTTTLLEDLQEHHAQGVALARLAERQALREELRSYASTLRSTEEHAVDTVSVHADRYAGGVSSGDGSSGNAISDAAGDRAGDAARDGDAVVGLGVVKGTGRDLSALVDLSGDEFDRVFVDAMIEHLGAGIAMATDAGSGPVSGGALEALAQQERAQVSQLEQWRTAWFQNGSKGD